MNKPLHRRRCGQSWLVHALALAVAFVTLMRPQARAIAPPYVPDEDLANYPILVVAQWKKADFKPHHRYRRDGNENVVVAMEAFTELQIIRVIKGDLKPGTHRLKVGWGISWSQEGVDLSSGSSTELLGDVDNVSTPNLWFLRSERSWDENDRVEYLSVNNYRAIQPLVLEDYFRRLGSKHPEKEVPELLSSDDPELIHRALRYVCGGVSPALDADRFSALYLEPQKPGKLLKNQANSVRKVVEQTKVQGVRATALVAYWKLAGVDALDFVRVLLRDANPSVRGAAVVLLARQKDERSVQPIIEAVEGVRDGGEACSIIKALASWGDVRLVPALISFLRNGEYAGAEGDDLLIPALKAKEALYSLTGHYFAFDVGSSGHAWDTAKRIASREGRKRRLDELQPEAPFPLKADVVGDGTTNTTVRVTNRSEQKVVVTKYPQWAEQKWPGGVAGCGPGEGETRGKSSFVTLAPGASTNFGVTLLESFLLADSGTRKLTLAYTENGNPQGVNAWIGLVNVEFGADWTEARNAAKVEEKWPNGNLKAVGQRVNGKRVGDWQFFNEDGDRTEIIGYTGGHGSAVCNPEHPANKGAGKRTK